MSEKETPAPTRAGGSFLRAVIYKARSNAAEIFPQKNISYIAPKKAKIQRTFLESGETDKIL